MLSAQATHFWGHWCKIFKCLFHSLYTKLLFFSFPSSQDTHTHTNRLFWILMNHWDHNHFWQVGGLCSLGWNPKDTRVNPRQVNGVNTVVYELFTFGDISSYFMDSNDNLIILCLGALYFYPVSAWCLMDVSTLALQRVAMSDLMT